MAPPHTRGFTLLEIMLVMVVMAAVAAFVLPNLFRPATATLDDSARHLARLLRLASEEAQLRGVPLRWNAWSDHYNFELAADGSEWQPLTDQPFASQPLPDGVSISEVKLADGVQFFSGAVSQFDTGTGDAAPDGGDTDKQKTSEKAPLGSVVLMSDGMLSLADVRLHSAAGEVHIELRPGPAGIRIVDGGP